MTAYFLSVLANFLGRQKNIPGMAPLFWLLIGATALLTLSGVMGTIGASFNIATTVVGLGGYVAYGVIFLIIGLRLQKSTEDLFGLRQALGITALVSGILLLTFFGVIFGVVGILAWTIMASIMLFRAAVA